MFESIVTVVHVLTCLLLILIILLQAGKGGGVSAAFGGGAGAALGQRSAATVLGKVTAGSAVLFMLTSMTLALLSSPTSSDPTRAFVEGQDGGVADVKAADAAVEKAKAPAGKDKAPADKAEAPPADKTP